eukprot:361840-Chlamydomonas_euryale.AAC.16
MQALSGGGCVMLCDRSWPYYSTVRTNSQAALPHLACRRGQGAVCAAGRVRQASLPAWSPRVYTRLGSRYLPCPRGDLPHDRQRVCGPPVPAAGKGVGFAAPPRLWPSPERERISMRHAHAVSM